MWLGVVQHPPFRFWYGLPVPGAILSNIQSPGADRELELD